MIFLTKRLNYPRSSLSFSFLQSLAGGSVSTNLRRICNCKLQSNITSPSLLPTSKVLWRVFNSFELKRLCHAVLPDHGPVSCSFLSAGQAFTGTHSVSPPHQEEESSWTLSVRILGCDFQRGYICGSMKALYVLVAHAPPVVETYWDGEIMDTRNFTFHSETMSIRPEDDMQYWSKFPSFSQYAVKLRFDGCAPLDLSTHPHIYMRWYERSEKNPGSYHDIFAGGFYYVCISCPDGSIKGFCYDPVGEVFVDPVNMKFVLKAVNEGRSGFSSSSYELQ